MIHDFMVSALWPGSDPTGPEEYRNRGLVGSAVARPFHTAFREELYKSLFEKAAALFHSLIANHPFHNGNKRTAVVALDHFLLANGYFLLLDNAGMYALAKETASYREKGISHEEIFQHIQTTIREFAVPLRQVKPKLPATMYSTVLRVRRRIRNHKLNQGPRE